MGDTPSDPRRSLHRLTCDGLRVTAASDDATTRSLVSDARRAPFFYQTEDAFDALRERFSGARRTTAIAVYVVLTETANRLGGEKARDGFRASRTSVAKMVGVSVDTFDRYVSELVEIGLLEVERERVEGVNLPNRWRLLSPPRVAPGAGGSRTGAVRGSRTGAAQVLEEPRSEERETTSPVGVPPLVKIDGRNLGFDALAETCRVPIQNKARVSEMTKALKDIRGYFAAENPNLGAADFEQRLAGEIVRRAGVYRVRMSGATLTPSALAKWWHDFAPDTGRRMDDDVLGV